MSPQFQRFETGELASLAGVSLRQMKWWDERNVVVPRIEGHRRIYDREDAIMILLVSELRRKGFSLQCARQFLPKLQRAIRMDNVFAVVVGEKDVSFCDDAHFVIDIMKAAKQPAVLISIRDAVQKVAAQ